MIVYVLYVYLPPFKKCKCKKNVKKKGKNDQLDKKFNQHKEAAPPPLFFDQDRSLKNNLSQKERLQKKNRPPPDQGQNFFPF